MWWTKGAVSLWPGEDGVGVSEANHTSVGLHTTQTYSPPCGSGQAGLVPSQAPRRTFSGLSQLLEHPLSWAIPIPSPTSKPAALGWVASHHVTGTPLFWNKDPMAPCPLNPGSSLRFKTD